MKPAAFHFHRATSTSEAVAVLRQGLDADLEARVIAGGQSLVAMMNLRLARPQLLVDLNNIDELAYVKPGSDFLRVGAMTRQRTIELSEDVRRGWPLLSEALPYVGHTPLRSRGTIGGSLAHADPGAELCAVGLALDASITVRGPGGDRKIDMTAFFKGPFTTALAPDEVLAEIVIPSQPLEGSGWAFEEVSRQKGGFAMAGVAVQLNCGEDGRISRARLAYLSLGAIPMRANSVEMTLIGEAPTPEVIEAAAQATAADLSPLEDIHAGTAYRSQLAHAVTVRALTRAVKRAVDSWR